MKTFKLTSDKAFFTSDLHLWHEHVIWFDKRPCNDIEHMHQMIIDKWNAKVPKDATVFILGDVSWKSKKYFQHIIDQLNGTKVLINGNHDIYDIQEAFDESCDIAEVEITDLGVNGCQRFAMLCHYPMLEWKRSQHEEYHFHGHLHGKLGTVTGKNRFDVCIARNDMEPYSWEDIMSAFAKDELRKIKDSQCVINLN